MSLRSPWLATLLAGCGAAPATIRAAMPLARPATPELDAADEETSFPDEAALLARVDALATRALAELTCPPEPREDEPVWQRLGRADECDELPFVGAWDVQLETFLDPTPSVAVLQWTRVQHGGCGNDVEDCGTTRVHWLVGPGFEVQLASLADDEELEGLAVYSAPRGTVVGYTVRGSAGHAREQEAHVWLVGPDAVLERATGTESLIGTPEGEVFDVAPWAWRSLERHEQAERLRSALRLATGSPEPVEPPDVLSHAPSPALRRQARDALRTVALDEVSAAEFAAAWQHVRFLAESSRATRFLFWLRDLGWLGRYEDGRVERIGDPVLRMQSRVSVGVTDRDGDGRPEWLVREAWFDEDTGDESSCRVFAEDLAESACDPLGERVERLQDPLARVIAGLRVARCDDSPECVEVRTELLAQGVVADEAEALLRPFTLGAPAGAAHRPD